MSLKYSSTRILHDDHMATIALLTEVERVVLARQAAPAQDDQTGRFIDRLCKTVNGEISGHFDYEEASVFPVLAEYGMAPASLSPPTRSWSPRCSSPVATSANWPSTAPSTIWP